jgi:hypothetical protein
VLAKEVINIRKRGRGNRKDEGREGRSEIVDFIKS